MHYPYVFRDSTGLTTTLKVLLGLGAAMALLELWSSFTELALLNRDEITEEEAMRNDLRVMLVGLLHMGLYLATAIVFGIWIVRSHKNVRALGAQDLPIGPGWAVGFFFIPIVNLWKPYQAMKSLWQASENPVEWQFVPASPILPIWWTLWLITGFLGQAAFRMSMRADTLQQFKNATGVQIASEIASLPLCLVALVLVSSIHKAQNERLVEAQFPDQDGGEYSALT